MIITNPKLSIILNFDQFQGIEHVRVEPEIISQRGATERCIFPEEDESHKIVLFHGEFQRTIFIGDGEACRLQMEAIGRSIRENNHLHIITDDRL